MRVLTQRCGLGRRRFTDSFRIAAVTMVVGLAGCGDVDIYVPDWNWDDFDTAWNTDHEARASFRHDLAGAEAIALTGVSGSVEIVGSSDASGIVVAGIRRVRSHSVADARDHLIHLDVEVRKSGGTWYVDTRQPGLRRGRSYQVDYRIELPRRTNVFVTHAAGGVEIRSIDGDVGVEAAAGAVKLLDLRSNVRATVAAGSVDASISLPPSGRVDLRSGAGDIDLSVPVQTSASLHAIARVGAVRSVDLDLRDEDPRASVLKAVLGDGDGEIRLETAAGDIMIKGRQGGGGGT